jgi:hypothetical protein
MDAAATTRPSSAMRSLRKAIVFQYPAGSLPTGGTGSCQLFAMIIGDFGTSPIFGSA